MNGRLFKRRCIHFVSVTVYYIWMATEKNLMDCRRREYGDAVLYVHCFTPHSCIAENMCGSEIVYSCNEVSSVAQQSKWRKDRNSHSNIKDRNQFLYSLLHNSSTA